MKHKDYILASISGKSGEVRIDCPECNGKQNGTLSANADKGDFCCYRCGFKGKVADEFSHGKPDKSSMPAFLWG